MTNPYGLRPNSTFLKRQQGIRYTLLSQDLDPSQILLLPKKSEDFKKLNYFTRYLKLVRLIGVKITDDVAELTDRQMVG